ncbi:type II secretion system F family protein [Ruegeria sp. HKCCD8929]|uniref:type II secretion system F family protein n=1 Tax=Ruegeria sp. HKCCD8929 TaxID=2683006 RepID=UPI0014891937
MVAASEVQALNIIEATGTTIYELRPEGTGSSSKPWYTRDISFSSGKFLLNHQASAAELMAVVFQARIPLADGLRILSESVDSPAMRLHFERTGQLVEDGVPFTEAFQTAGTGFSPIFCSLLKVSFEANKLPDALGGLAKYLRNQAKSRAQILGALVYPAILIVAAVVVILVFSFVVAPSLEPIFRSANVATPSALRAFLALRSGLTEASLLVIGSSALLLGSVTVLLSSESGRSIRLALLHRMPVIRGLLRRSALIRDIRALLVLLEGGISLPAAFRELSSSADERASGLYATQAFEELQKGGRAWRAIEKAPTTPNVVKELFRVGEETNSLVEALSPLAEFLEFQQERQLQRMIGYLTPMMTLVLGGGIGVLIYSIMSAILQVNELAF